ncbi:L-aminoadipate-semialdehyde dehydrogenase-phosphopantetheinyl transferase-like [Dreissena polymorpha]|uniref:L-aminoadipate-semialdehyde dehydrogenase-phosphopantetheinyl transferase n=1 Tax=Dreissena polymorpha TaxID=45954 RepID=A0A9D4QSN3_DREPO|nr:L-aminoadipate-semialdehyde dehydrogenase-phosphopantetheinyl transferase-like [Dreissena polymorpha]KAH3842146.1 hypothetical protein DPMN_115640 [Dreissena polymorpha]
MSVTKHIMTSIRWYFNSGKWNPSAADWVRAAQRVQPEEKDRIGKFVFKKDAKSSMIGRLMLRRMLHRLTKIPYADIRLARTEKGKPYLTNELPPDFVSLSFNVSHHGDLVVLAGELACDVGIDVMKLETPVGAQTVQDFFHTMRRQFTAEEWACIRQGTDDREQLNTFYRLWCLKESYVKTLGVGIGFEVKRLSFTLRDSLTADGGNVHSTVLAVDGSPALGWEFSETMIEDHCVAVARKLGGDVKSFLSKEERLHNVSTFQSLTFEELLEGSVPLSEPDELYGNIFISKKENPWST